MEDTFDIAVIFLSVMLFACKKGSIDSNNQFLDDLWKKGGIIL